MAPYIQYTKSRSNKNTYTPRDYSKRKKKDQGSQKKGT